MSEQEAEALDTTGGEEQQEQVQPVEDWKKLVPEYGQEFEEVKNSKTFEDFFKDYDTLRTYRGQAIRLPGPDASDEDRAEARRKLLERDPEGLVMRPRNDEERIAFQKSLGMPDEAAAYNVEVDGFSPDPDRMSSIREHAHAAGLTTDQFDMFVTAMAQDEVAAAKGQSGRQLQSLTELREEWGAAYEQKIDGARDFLTKMQAPAAFLNAERDGMFDAGDYRWIDDLATRIGGEGQPTASNGHDPSKLTPAEAQQKIDEIRGNKDHAFNSQTADPIAKQRAIEEMLSLHRMLPGGSQQAGGVRAFGEPVN